MDSISQHKLDADTCVALRSFAGPLNGVKLSQLLAMIDKLTICTGQPDDHFLHMVLAKKGKILSSNGIAAYVDVLNWMVNCTHEQSTHLKERSSVILWNVHVASMEHLRAQCTTGGRSENYMVEIIVQQSSSETNKFTNEIS